MQRLGNGFLAGFLATVVLSALMVAKAKMGMAPDLNVIKMLAKMSGTGSPAVGWLIHFGIGTLLWGGLFALIEDKLPGGSATGRGVIFSIGAWLLMMVLVMPMAGAGFFGLHMGMAAPIMTLVLHMIFGGVLGAVYGWRTASQHTAATA